jgi:short-subunit dehydrogenase
VSILLKGVGMRRVVVVTGASAGAGRAIARLFAQRGDAVALIARGRDRLEAARREIVDAGGAALALPADVADFAALEEARDRAVAAFGRIDVWVNCAMATVVSPISRMRAEEYRRVTEVTYLGYVHGTLLALDVMRPRNAGVIVQVGSALAYRAIPLQSAYCAAKFAVRGFTDALRTELVHERSRVRVTMVQMPALNTPQFEWARNKFADKYRPVGTVYQPEVAARAVWRAASEHPRELWVGWSSIRTILGQLLAPALLDRMAARAAWEPQLTDAPEPIGRLDNLDAPVPGPYGAHGRFDDIARDAAIAVAPGRMRMVLVALGAVGGLAWALRAERARRGLGEH